MKDRDILNQRRTEKEDRKEARKEDKKEARKEPILIRMKKNLSLFGLIISLAVMYGTNIGIPGIAHYYDGKFKLLDMRFVYSTETVQEMIIQLGPEGIQHYLSYFMIDVVFIIFLFLVQHRISISIYAAGNWNKLKAGMMILIAGRGILDLAEDLLLTMTFKMQIPVHMTPMISCITSLKFVCMGGWIAVLFFVLLMRKQRHNKGTTGL